MLHGFLKLFKKCVQHFRPLCKSEENRILIFCDLGTIGHRTPDFEYPKSNSSWNGFYDFRRFRHQNQSRLRCICHNGITGGNYRLTSKFAPCARYFSYTFALLITLN